MREAEKAFTGMVPMVEPHLLPAGASQELVNGNPLGGALVPYKGPAKVADLAKPGTKLAIYRFGRSLDDDARFWFHWLHDTDVARRDPGRCTGAYLFHGGRPAAARDGFDHGDLQRADADGLVPAGHTGGDGARHRDRDPAAKSPANLERQSCLLAYTFVSAWGEEAAEPGERPIQCGHERHAQRYQHGRAAGRGIQHHAQAAVYLDDRRDGHGDPALLERDPGRRRDVLRQGGFHAARRGAAGACAGAPPADLFGIMAHPGGFLVGFSGKRVYRSEVFKPYGWPYYSPVADEIVGGAVMGQATVICTKGDTYLATQADPVTMTPTRLDGHQPCVAKRTIRAFKGGVVYASPDGLVMVDQSGGVGVVTEGLISRAQWQAYKPASMHAAVHDNRYFCWYDTGAERGGLIFDLTRGAMSLTRTDVYATAAYSDGRRDELFLALADGNVHSGTAAPRRCHAARLQALPAGTRAEHRRRAGAGRGLSGSVPAARDDRDQRRAARRAGGAYGPQRPPVPAARQLPRARLRVHPGGHGRDHRGDRGVHPGNVTAV